jgi:hypothetical protein
MRHPSNPSHTWLLVILGLLGAPLLAVQSAAGVSIQILEQHSDRLRVLYSVGPGVRLTSGNSGGTASAALLGSLVKTGVVGIPLTGEVELEIVEVSPGGTFDMPRNVGWDLPLVGPVSLGSTGFVRNQRVVQLNFSPRLVNGGPQVQLFNRVVADLYFTAARSDHKPHHLRGDGNPNRSWEERLYSKALINYEQARYWRQTGAAAKAVVQDATANDYLRLTVRQQGVHRITGQELADAGVPLSEIVPDAIRLRYGGGLAQAVSGSPALGVRLREIPIVVEDGEDGRFDNGDALLFYGEPAERWVFSSGNDGEYFWRQNPYTKDNVYFLEWTGDGNGLRGGVVSGALSVPDALATDNYRERLHVEEEKESVIELEGIKSGYDWFWETFRGNAADFTTTLRDVVTDDPVDVDVRFWGLSGGSHRFDLRWNFDVIGNVSFSGPQASTLSASSRRGALEGVNRLGVLHRDNTASRLDWYELEYTRQLHARDDGGVSFDWLSAAGLKNADVSSANSTTQFHLSGFNNGRPRIFECRAPRTLKEVVDFEYEATTGSATFQGLHTGFGVPPLYVAIDDAGWKRPAAIERKSPARLKTSDNGADYVIITHRNFCAAAERLAAWRAEDDRFGTPLVTRVADVEDIYDEFSGGLLDPMAIRSFVNYAVDNWDPAPVFILLMGDGSYDYKNNLGLSDANWIPAFQDGASMYDEWYVRIEGGDELPDLAIGRLPVGSTKEAEAVVDKLISYDRNPEIGLWQARALLVADDIVNPATHQDESFFVRDAEQMASDFLPQDLAVSKLYFGRFPLQGRTKPSAREAFVRRFNEGALILTYIGHGNPETLTHEQIFVLTRDIDGIDNGGRLPLVYTAASQVGVFDDPSRQSIPEVFVNKPDGGAIGFISATRVGIHHSNMILAKEFHEIMYNSDDDRVAVGLALMAAKQRVTLSPGDRTNVQRYSLLGDPAQILNRPLLSVQIEAPDSLQARQEVRFAGRVQDASGDAITDFSGQALVQAFDSSVRSVVEGNPWEQPGVPIFRSLARVEGGVFAGVFRVPRDISYRESEGSMSAYVWNEGTQTAFGSVRGIAIGGVEQGLTPGNNGPTVALAFDGAAGGGAFRDGDFVSSRPRLTALIEDEDGINITGAIGHEIELQIDGELFKVTDSYTSQNGGYKTGLLDYEIAELDPGSHQLRLKVWDNLNNSSQVEATIRVAEASVPSLTSVIFHPNPMQDQGHFTYTLATPAHAVSIKVFTLSGRLVDELKGGELPGYNQVSWEPPSALANGTYLYHIQATTEDGFGFEATSAVQVVR